VAQFFSFTPSTSFVGTSRGRLLERLRNPASALYPLRSPPAPPPFKRRLREPILLSSEARLRIVKRSIATIEQDGMVPSQVMQGLKGRASVEIKNVIVISYNYNENFS
jgi:hypothetical protein